MYTAILMILLGVTAYLLISGSTKHKNGRLVLGVIAGIVHIDRTSIFSNKVNFVISNLKD